MAITAVGKTMVRDAQYFRLACRIIAELGAQYVKTYYVEEGFETITASCPVPIVMAGGKKLPELEALTMAYNAVQQGASGVDMGRNIFQCDAPKAMIAAVAAVVHKNMKPKEAFDLFETLKAKGESEPPLRPLGIVTTRRAKITSAETARYKASTYPARSEEASGRRKISSASRAICVEPAVLGEHADGEVVILRHHAFRKTGDAGLELHRFRLVGADVVDGLDPAGEECADRIGIGIDQVLRRIERAGGEVALVFRDRKEQASGLLFLHREEQRGHGDIGVDQMSRNAAMMLLAPLPIATAVTPSGPHPPCAPAPWSANR